MTSADCDDLPADDNSNADIVSTEVDDDWTTRFSNLDFIFYTVLFFYGSSETYDIIVYF